MLVVGIGVLAGVLFGLLTTLVRRGLMRQPNAIVGAMVITSSAALMVLAVTILTGKGGDLLDLRVAVGYFALGIVVPGISQILFVVAVREVGASRTAIMIGTAPLLATIIAVAFRGEALVIGLVVGTVLIVIGGASLAWDRNLPPGFRARGMLFAFFCALLFAVRDNAVRMLDGASDMDPRAATTWTLIGAAVAVAVYATVSRRGAVLTEYRSVFRSFIPAGVVFALAYLALVVALEIGRVTVFAPLNAMQSMWTVLFAWLLLGKSDGIGARIVLAMLLVVSGGILIGIFR
ncbi:MAG: DMT family transporter [Thermoleophilia bacterium]